MAHNLNFNALSGQFSMFAATDRHGLPWHKLGQMVGSAQTWENAMQLAHLDWSVSKQSLFDSTGRELEAWGIFRDDNKDFLGTVGSAFEPIQNVRMGAHIDEILKSIDGAHYESAGALGKGERVWAMARLPESADIRIKGTDDISKSFLLITQGHDGTLSYVIKLTSVRVVCQNTLTMALGGRTNAQVKTGPDCIKIRHTSNAESRITGATRTVQSVNTAIADLNGKLNELALRKVNRDTNRAVMDKLFGDDWRDSSRKRNQIEEIARLFEQNDHNAFPEIKGTAYNLLNAVTEYHDHYKNVRMTDGRQGMTIEQVRTENALFGGSATEKNAAIEAILSATEGCPRRPEPVTVPMGSGNSVDSILSMVNA